MNDNGVTRRTMLRGTALGILGAAALQAGDVLTPTAAKADTAPLALTVDTANPGHAVSPELYGAFFEEINYAGVGGLYAELIQNRAFMATDTPAQWFAAGGVPLAPGEFGSALQVNAGSPAEYVALPAGIVGGLTDFTIATWVNPSQLVPWQRLFDFGTGPGAYMFITVAAGGTNNPRFSITVDNYWSEQRLDAPDPLPLNKWTHLAVTLSGTTATLYVNGVAVDTNPSMTLNPSSLGSTPLNYIGRSQFAGDPYLNAAVDEFQIYSRALSAAEIASLQSSAGGTPGGGDVLWYRFDKANQNVAVDSSGSGRDGTIELLPRVPGEFGNALQVGGPNPGRFTRVPDGVTSGLTDFTIATWVNPAGLTPWQRLFDFGTGTSAYMFITVAAGGTNNPRFSITVNGYGDEQRLDAPDPLPLNEWTHLAVTLSGTTGTLYVNGVAVDTNPSMTLNPSSLGSTPLNYIGRSQFAPDPYLNAAVDEFQIYSRALSAAEIASLQSSAGGTPGGGDVLWYRFDETGGPTVTDSSGNGRNGTIEILVSEWTLVADGSAGAYAALDTATPLNSALTQSLRLDLNEVTAGQRAGMANSGYFGVPVVPGQEYRVSFFAKASGGFAGPLTVSLESQDGLSTYASAAVGHLTADWKRFTTVLQVPFGVTESTAGQFVIGIDNRGSDVTEVPAGTSVWLQVVSVFPPTYKNRKNGLRPDLVELLAGIGPKILRFPGGNYVEGVTIANRWNWKQTIGHIWERPGHQNDAWGYWSDDGLGLLEFLKLAEDLGATPVIGVWAGLTLNGTIVPQNQLAPYVQDALDLVEYITGPVTSTWGAQRAAHGHPRPFAMPYLEIGNEDFLTSDSIATYNAYRYPMFYDALKAAYPDIKLIATISVTSRPMDVLDLHYYNDAGWFEQASTMFDSYDRGGPQIFVGEYAATAGAGPTGLLGNSVGEAAFLTGLERNSDIVHMSSYAPLFANYSHTQWNPDLIGYDQVTSFGSTSYWVQRMFAANVGDHVLPVTVSSSGLYHSATIDSRTGRIYLKIVNPAGTDVATSLVFSGSRAKFAKIEVLAGPDPAAGNTLANPDAIVPVSSVLGGQGGVFAYTAPANSVTVVTVR
jgi:alpha-L-arabinofuranosidase